MRIIMRTIMATTITVMHMTKRTDMVTIMIMTMMMKPRPGATRTRRSRAN